MVVGLVLITAQGGGLPNIEDILLPKKNGMS